jgi:hypothetical protein
VAESQSLNVHDFQSSAARTAVAYSFQVRMLEKDSSHRTTLDMLYRASLGLPIDADKLIDGDIGPLGTPWLRVAEKRADSGPIRSKPN